MTTFRITLWTDLTPTSRAKPERPTSFPIVTWRKLAQTCAHNLNKDRLVAVEGRLQNRQYTRQDGSKELGDGGYRRQRALLGLAEGRAGQPG